MATIKKKVVKKVAAKKVVKKVAAKKVVKKVAAKKVVKKVAAKKVVKKVAAKKVVKKVAAKKSTGLKVKSVLSTYDDDKTISYTIEHPLSEVPASDFIVFVLESFKSNKGMFHEVSTGIDKYGPIGSNDPLDHKEAVKLIKKGYNVLVSTGSVPPQFVN